MNDTALNRLKHERREWRKNHPFGFVAKPCVNPDGSLNYMVWECYIPGLSNTCWEKGKYKMFMIFSDDYPMRPPICKFSPIIFHPNVCRNCGTVRIPLLDINFQWNSVSNIQYILLVIQCVLHEPTIIHIVNELAYIFYSQPDRTFYSALIRLQAKIMSGDLC